MLRLHLLGSIELLDESGNDLLPDLQQPKRLGLLAYLATSPLGRYLPRDTLVGLFWPDLPDERARRALRQAFHYLRAHLGHTLFGVRGDEVAVEDSMLWCDARAFEVACDAGRYGEALTLYRGEFMQGFHLGRSGTGPFEDWLTTTRRRLRRLAKRVAAARSEATAGSGDLASAAEEATKALELATLDEPLTRRVMELLDASGDRAGALRLYEAFRRRLEDELGAGPSSRTRELAERLRARREPG